jgi:hypothetical protein
MPRINDSALEVPDLARAGALHEGVFGFRHMSTVKNPGRTSRHFTDGFLFLTMSQYNNEDSPEAGFTGAGPCIQTFGIVVVDPAAYKAKPLADDAVPVDAVPVDAIPVDTIPVDTVPVDTKAAAR